MMETQQELLGLISVAEEHQKAAQAALEGLSAARAALAKERAALAQAAANVYGAADNVKQAVEDAAPTIRIAAREGVETAVIESLGGASEAAIKALETAAKPVFDNLSSVLDSAAQASTTLNRAVASFGWKWALMAGGAAAGGVMAVLLAGWLSVWWSHHQIEELSMQRHKLAAEIDGMQALAAEAEQMKENVAALEKRGGKIKISTCGGRLCIEASSNQGKDFPDWKGPWANKETGVTSVIPRGY